MNNNGYTKIPNAIIRSHNLTVEEKLTWMYIASMPNGYQFTVDEACAMLRINVKTWRRCVANLESAGLVEVGFNPGKKNAYKVLTPTTSDPGSQTAPLPNETPTPLPFETRGTHTYNKDLLNNTTTTTTCACAREKLMQELLTDARIELAMMQHHIAEEQYRRMVAEILADWQFRDLPDSDYNLTHFSSVMRYKVANNNRNNGNNQQSGQPSDIRAKLDADAAKAMAALAAEIGKPKIVPF